MPYFWKTSKQPSDMSKVHGVCLKHKDDILVASLFYRSFVETTE